MGGWNQEDIPDLSGKTAVVTGANSGLGFHTSRELANHGAYVVMACRSRERGEAALQRLRDAAPGASVELRSLDLADLDSIETCAKEINDAHDGIDILCNNAGVMALPLRRTQQGFEMQIGTNHLGHFAFTSHLLSRLLARPGSRIVNVSSQAHRFGKMRFDDINWNHRYNKWQAYGQSKLANLLFTFELQRRLSASGKNSISLAAHPGYAATNLQLEGARMAGSSIKERLMLRVNGLVAQSSRHGALPSLRACTDPSATGGDYYGPSGFAERAGPPVKVGYSARAGDAAAGARLWELSVELTGARFAELG
jgi:NAD(P)-dependent dehydrogenase (short-subunit alcohol dehydrogenase family)